MNETILYEKCFTRQTIFYKNRLMDETILVFPLLLRLVFCGKMMVFYMAVICMFLNILVILSYCISVCYAIWKSPSLTEKLRTGSYLFSRSYVTG